MKLLVTGGLGFIGSNFILKLLGESDDFEIVNVDAQLHGADKRNLSRIENHDNYQFVKGNITNKRLMEDLISKCDAVINFAAEAHVDRSISDPNSFLVPSVISIFGGEPLLHPRIKQVLELIRKHWPNAVIRFITNG